MGWRGSRIGITAPVSGRTNVETSSTTDRWRAIDGKRDEPTGSMRHSTSDRPAQAARMAAMLPRPRYYDRNRSTPYLERRSATIQRWAQDITPP